MRLIKKVLLHILFLTLLSPCGFATIRVGTVDFDPPYVLSLNQGFEIGLIKLICQQLGQPCELIPMEYFSLFTALDNNKIDIAIDGIDFYTAPGPADGPYIYSLPYLLSEGQFLVLKTSGIKKIKELPKGSSVGLVRERLDASKGIFYNFFIYTYPQFNAVLFDDMNTLIDCLNQGSIAAAFVDNNEARYWEADSSGLFHYIGKPVKVADGIGIMALPQNLALIQQINQAILQIEKNNEYLNLYTTYFGMGQ